MHMCCRGLMPNNLLTEKNKTNVYIFFPKKILKYLFFKLYKYFYNINMYVYIYAFSKE